MKLLAHYGDRKYLCTPGFVGQGYVERVINGKNLQLRFFRVRLLNSLKMLIKTRNLLVQPLKLALLWITVPVKTLMLMQLML